MNRLTLGLVGVLVALALVVSAFAVGFVAGHSRDLAIPDIGIERSPAERAVKEVEGILEREALKPSSDTSLTVGAINGVLESLGDDYAMYFDAKHYEYFNEQNMGEFFGIGVTISEGKDGTVHIVSVIEDTPAEKSGLKADDRIVGIDGVERDKWDTEEVVKRIRGPEGSKVKVSVARKGEKSLREFEIERAKIDYPNVMKKMVGKDVGYISLMQFNAKAAEDVGDAVKELEGKGAKGFVFDLRNNPGGMLDESVDLSSLFIEDGVVLRVEKREGPEEVHRAKGGAITDAPMVLLVNENSASAAEIVAGALQDYDRARIVGVKTFGKGSVQTVKTLTQGGAIKFTIAHYLTPKSRVIDGKGVEPDVVVEMKPELAADEETDTQLKRGIAELRKLL